MPTAQQSVHLIAATVGFLSFFLCWLAIVWGLILRNAWASTRMRHSTVYGIHHTVALLGLCLALVHAFAQLAVPLGPVRLVDEFIPFTNQVDPVGIGVGVIGLELLVAASLSILIQRRLGFSRWRALHALTYVAFMLVVGHVLLSGSDTGPAWVWGSVMAAWLSTVVLWLTTTSYVQARWQRLPIGHRPAAEVTVGVDPVRCGRFGFCEHEAPQVFSLRADGRLSYAASVPADQLDAVVQAMKVCPARAISVNHAPTVRMTSPPPKPPEPTGPRGGGRVGGSRRGAGGRGRRSSPTATGGVHRLDGSPVRGESW
jgi:sulfoxide reductase heme-binding subunit YedZ